MGSICISCWLIMPNTFSWVYGPSIILCEVYFQVLFKKYHSCLVFFIIGFEQFFLSSGFTVMDYVLQIWSESAACLFVFIMGSWWMEVFNFDEAQCITFYFMLNVFWVMLNKIFGYNKVKKDIFRWAPQEILWFLLLHLSLFTAYTKICQGHEKLFDKTSLWK